MIMELTLPLTSHSNTRCKGTFGSFTIKQIRTNAAPLGCSVFLARLSLATSETWPKINHHWPECEAKRRILKLASASEGLGGQRRRCICRLQGSASTLGYRQNKTMAGRSTEI